VYNGFAGITKFAEIPTGFALRKPVGILSGGKNTRL